MRTFVATLMIFSSLVAQAADYGVLPKMETEGTWPNVSIVALLGGPGTWAEKKVSVFGYARYDLHGTMIFGSSEHCRGFHPSYGLKLVIELMPKLREETQFGECTEVVAFAEFHPNDYEDPVPNVIVMREVPGYLYAQAVRVLGDSDAP